MKAWICLLLALLMVPLCGLCEEEMAKWTVMVYMCGGDLESERGEASRDIREMMDALPGDGACQVVLFPSGASSWEMEIDESGGSYYLVTGNGLETLEETGRTNMGEAGSLSRFLTTSCTACPAQHYALILWDHGSGPLSGLCFDERYETEGQEKDRLTLQELTEALEDSPFSEQKLSVIGMDACLMASLETADMLSPYAEYLIASEETEPAMGWDYSFLKDAGGIPDGLSFGKSVTDAYAAAYTDTLADVTLSVVDLEKADALADRFSEAAGGIEISQETYDVYARIRYELHEMGGIASDYFDLVDFRGLVDAWQEIGVDGAEEILLAFEEAVPYRYSNTALCSGLSIYYPMENKERYASPWSAELGRLGGMDGYRDFLKKNCALWQGASMADWQSLGRMSADDPEGHRISMFLTEDQATQFASARLRVLEELYPGDYLPIYTTDQVKLSPGSGRLSAEYHDEAMFLRDDEGKLVTSAMYYREKGDLLSTLATLTYPDEDSILGEKWEVAWLVYRRDAAGKYAFVQAQKQLAENMLSGKSDLSLENCTGIRLATVSFIPSRDDEGRLLPLNEWEMGDYLVYTPLPGADPLQPVILPLQDGYRRYALFEITDLQGNTYATELYPLPVQYRTTLLTDLEMMHDSHVTVTLSEVCAITADSPHLLVLFCAENHTDERLWVNVTPETYRASTGPVYMEENFSGKNVIFYNVLLEPGEKKYSEIRLPQSFFEENGMDVLEDMTLRMTIRDEHMQIVEPESSCNVRLDFDASMLRHQNAAP